MCGPLPPPHGGTTVSFNQLVEDLRQLDGVELQIINTYKKDRVLDEILAIFLILFRLVTQAPRADVIAFHASVGRSLVLGPFIWLISRLFRVPWIFRGFGGDFPRFYQALPSWARQLLLRTVLKADVVMLQTKESINFFADLLGSRLYWLPTSRPMTTEEPFARNAANRFVFIGHVKPSKGIYHLIEAGRDLPSDVLIDVYGPLQDGITSDDFRGQRVLYKGELEPAQVSETLKRYDILLLPTFWIGEGYPGVILEAYRSGLAVIATNWKAIPEIVDASTGILIEPRSTSALAEAITDLHRDPARVEILSKNALDRAKFFRSDHWAQEFLACARRIMS